MIYVPPRKFLLLGAISAILILSSVTYLRQEHSISGLSTKALGLLCNTPPAPGPERLSDKDFDNGMYSPGNRDSWLDEDEDIAHWSGEDEDATKEYEKSAKMINIEKLLRGNATTHFRDNLRPEYQYITGWGDGGFTNQFMAISNLLFLSLITPHRIPIIPPFVSRPHLPMKAGYPAVSEFFDVERWARSINKEVLEWKDVKDLRGLAGKRAPDGSLQADGRDELGCWSVWVTANLAETKVYDNTFVPDHLDLDMSHTPVPREARLFPRGQDDDTHMKFSSLATLSHATSKNPNPLSWSPLDPIIPSHGNKATLPPDEQLMCYDFLYRVSTTVPFEWERDFSSAWNIVGKHAHWSDRIRSLTRQALAKTLEVIPREVMPPVYGDNDYREDRDGRAYHPHDIAALQERDRVRIPFICIHARHGDFVTHCDEERLAQGRGCPPDLSLYERLIEEVQQDLHSRGTGLKSGFAQRFPVIVTSDELDEEWWAEVARFGWKRVQFPPSIELDESESPPKAIPGAKRPVYPIVEAEPPEGWSAATYAKLWDRIIVESAVQGMATGFVGTQGSTMSLTAMRRVEHWQGGVTRFADFSM